MNSREWRVVAVGLLLAGCATTAPSVPTADMVWPLPPDSPRIRYVESLSSSDQFRKNDRNWLTEIVLGPDGKAVERMVKPYAVATDGKGRVYVTDTGIARVWVFDRKKNEVRFLGTSGQGQLSTPSGIAVDARGVVWVADTKLDRVFAYDEKGEVVLAIGRPEEFYSPAGLAVDPASGRLYVTDAGRHKIRVYDTVTGKFLFEFGSRGTAPGQFNFPTHLGLKRGLLYVTDTMNFRIQVLTLDGRFVRTYGQMGANFGQLARPKGVAVDSEGHVYVVDAAFGNFQIFDRGGELLLFVGQTGFKSGEFFLPAGLHIDDKDRIYVVDQYNRRVQVFEYLGKVDFARAGSSSAVE